jgi:predicted nucleotidyltransferase
MQVEIMLSEQDTAKILECARTYGAKGVWLFGSSLDPTRTPNDIDLGVEGLDSRQFFRFARDLYVGLSKPVDVVDLDDEPPLEEIIRQTGRKIYAA